MLNEIFFELLTVTRSTLSIANIVPVKSNAFERPTALSRSNRFSFKVSISRSLQKINIYLFFSNFEYIFYLLVLILDLKSNNCMI